MVFITDISYSENKLKQTNKIYMFSQVTGKLAF